MALSMSSDDDYQKALFVKLLSEASSTAPVQHWTQGLARLAQGLMGGLAAGRDRRNREEGREWLVKALMGGNAGTSPMGTLEMGEKIKPMTDLAGGPYEDQSKFNPMDAAVATKEQLAAGVPSYVPEQYRHLIGKAAVDQDLPIDVLARQTRQESGFNPSAVSSAWAQGISQFMPGTAREMGINPNDPAQAIPAQAAYLRQNIDRFGGSVPLGLAAYNAGPTRVAQAGGNVAALPAETQGYLRNILGRQPTTDFAQAGNITPQTAPALGQGVPPQLLEGLRSSNRYVQKQAMELAQQYLKPAEWDIKTDDAGNTVAVNKRNPQQRMIINAPPGLAESRAAQKSEEARAREVGEAKGKRQAALPEAVAQTDLALQTIEQIRTHPGRKWGVGTAAPLTNVMPGTDTRAFGNLVGQAKSQLFRQAYESLRGGGQISNIEGVKAENALARLDTAVSQQEFEKALNDYRDVLLTAKQRMRGMAGEPAQNEGGWVDLAPGVRIRERR